jgi:hypothetical protein
LSQFEDSSKTTEDFRKGYVAGLNEMYLGLIDLARLMINSPEETLDVKIIHDWAEDWQEKHEKFHFHKVPVFASTDLGMGDDLRILSKSMTRGLNSFKMKSSIN